MCMLLKLGYAKFGVSSNVYLSKIIKEKPLGDRLDHPPSLVKERLIVYQF